MRAALLSALLLLQACAELEPITLLRCGNAVIEPELGEDCDLFPEGTEGGARCGRPEEGAGACRLVCGPANGSATCPAGWGCGGDGLCRHGSGAFESAGGSELSVPATAALYVADFDGDGRWDLGSAGSAELEVRFGAQGGFEDPRREASGAEPPVIADLDPDGRADIVLPTSGGVLVVRGQEDRSFSPVAYPQLNLDANLPELTDLRVLPLRPPGMQGEVIVALISNRFGTCIDRPCGPTNALIGNHSVAEVLGRVPRGDLDGRGGTAAVLAFENEDRLWIVSMNGPDEFAPAAVVPLPGRVAGPAFVADLDGDGLDDVVLAVRGGGALHMAKMLGRPAPARLTAEAAAELDPVLMAGTGEADPRAIVAIGDLNGDGAADALLKRGVVLGGASPTLYPASPGDPDIVAGVIADLNRDHLPDLAIAPQGTRGVVVLIGTGQAVSNPAFVPTSEQVVEMRSGDFNGDLVGDLLIAERDEQRGAVLSLLTGRLQGAPSPPVELGAFPQLLGLEPMLNGDHGVPSDLISDLLVTSNSAADGSGLRSLAVMNGSADGRLRSGLGLVSNLGVGLGAKPTWVRAGRFSGADLIPDLIVGSTDGLWLVPGSGGASFDPQAMRRFDPIQAASCTGLLANGCLERLVQPLDGAADELLSLGGAADRCQQAVLDGGPVRLHALTVVEGDQPSLACGTVELPPSGLRPMRRALLADLDADGTMDLLMIHPAADARSGIPGSAQGAGLSLAYGLRIEAAGGSLVLSTSRFLVLPLPALSLRDAEAVQADADPELELMLLGAGGVSLADSTAGAYHLADRPVSRERGERLRQADLDGDGLMDLLVGARERVSSLRQVAHDDRR